MTDDFSMFAAFPEVASRLVEGILLRDLLGSG